MAQAIAPNQYELRARGVRVEYSTTSISGVAELSITRRRQTLTFKGDQIVVLSTSIGDLITVTLAATPDEGSTLFSFFLPSIRLSKEFGRESFRTIGVVTEERTTISGPPIGVQQTYKSLQMRGSARQVRFLAKKTMNAA